MEPRWSPQEAVCATTQDLRWQLGTKGAHLEAALRFDDPATNVTGLAWHVASERVRLRILSWWEGIEAARQTVDAGSMDSQKPWLADFIKSSLDAWFGELEGCRSADYQFQKIDDKLKAYCTVPCRKTVCLLKLPKPGIIEPPGEIFDGLHKIEAIFTKGTAKQIVCSGARHGTLLRLVDPVLRVTPHVNPPKPLVEITACETVDETEQVERNLASGCAVTEDQDIRERMFRYWAVKRHNRAPSAPASRGSPDSFKSQVDFSTQVLHEAIHSDGNAGEDDERDIFQQPFFTQVPSGLSGWGLTTPDEPTSDKVKEADTCSQKDHDLSSAKDIKGTNGSPVCMPANQTQQPAPEGDSLLPKVETITPRSESPLPPSTTTDERSGLARSRTPRPANPTPPRLQVPSAITTDYDKSSPVEISELGGNIPESPRSSADDTHEEPPSVSPKASPVKRVGVQRLAEQRPNQFQRWRKEKRRYVPRHLQRIPRQQAKLLTSLLDSGDSWQPPLVGRAQRPGEVPLDLLVELSDAADKRASDAASPPKFAQSEVSRRETRPTQRGPDQLKSAHPSEGDTSEPEESVAWSQSPPTQERRATRLPPNSPPPTLTRRKRPSDISDGGDKGSALSGRQDTSLGSSTSQDRGLHVHSLSHDHSPDHLRAASPTTEVPQPAHSSHAELNDKGLSQEDTLSTVPGVAGGSSPKKIQVSRTPYGAKGSKSPQILASRIASAITKKACDDGNLASTFVPGTYFEPSSGDMAAIAVAERSIKALWGDESSNPVPESDQNNIPVTNREAKVFEAMEFEDANPGKVSTSSCSANLEHALSASGGSPSKVRARPDKRDVLDFGSSNDLGTRLRQPGKGTVETASVEVGAGGRDSNVVEETGAGSFTKAAFGPGEKAYIRSPSETRVSISVPAKRKSTSPRNSNVPIKRQRQERKVTSTDFRNVELEKGASEYHEQQLRQVDGPEDSARRLNSPPHTESDHSDEIPVPDERGQHHVETPRLIGNPNASTHHSYPSWRVDNDGSSGMVAPPPTHGRRQRQPGSATLAPRPSSTSITRPSVYGGVDEEEAKIMADGSEEAYSLFIRYRAAYPEYQGNADDFLNSYCFVKEIWIREPWPKSIHPSHLDDAIFHHFHSYRPYARSAGTAAAGFVEFFHAFVEDPSHHQRIIRPSALENAPGRGGAVRTSTLGELSTNQGGQFFATAPVASTKIANPTVLKETIAEHQLQFQQLAETRGQAIEDRIDSIERWREDAARTGSPELGTPDVDRSLSPRTTPKRESPEPATKTSIPSTTAKPRESREPSVDLFIKPPKPVAVSTRRSSSVRTKRRTSMRDFWKGTSTAFTMFEQQYARLAAEKKGRVCSETPRSSSRG